MIKASKILVLLSYELGVEDVSLVLNQGGNLAVITFSGLCDMLKYDTC